MLNNFKGILTNEEIEFEKKKFKEHFCYGHSVEQEKLSKDIETEDVAATGFGHVSPHEDGVASDFVDEFLNEILTSDPSHPFN